MTTNVMTTSAKVKTKKSGIIAAACALLVLGGGITFFAVKGDKNNEVKKAAPYTGPLSAASQADADDTSASDDSSKGGMGAGTGGTAVELGAASYLTTTPPIVLEPSDKGTIESGFEGYDIEAKYLLVDAWKGIDNYAQHSYSMVIDVTAKDGYELPWADEEKTVYSHFGDVWVDSGHTEFFTLTGADSIVTYGYKTQNEDGEDILRFIATAEVPEDFELDKDTEIPFNINVVFWGTGDIIKTEGSFKATEKFDEAKSLDTALEIPYQIVTENDIETTEPEASETSIAEEETAVTSAAEEETTVTTAAEEEAASDAKGVGLVTNDKGKITEGFEGLEMEISELWYVPGENSYGVAINVRKTDGSPLDWTYDDHPYLIYGDLEPYMQATNAAQVDMSGGWSDDNDPNTMRFLISTVPADMVKTIDENTVIPFGVVGIAIDGKEVAKGNFESNIQYNLRKEIR